MILELGGKDKDAGARLTAYKLDDSMLRVADAYARCCRATRCGGGNAVYERRQEARAHPLYWKACANPAPQEADAAVDSAQSALPERLRIGATLSRRRRGSRAGLFAALAVPLANHSLALLSLAISMSR